MAIAINRPTTIRAASGPNGEGPLSECECEWEWATRNSVGGVPATAGS